MASVLGWIGQGLYAATSFAGYGFKVWEEVKDNNVHQLVGQELAACTTPAGACCVSGWKQILENVRAVPILSSVTAAIEPVATFGTGIIIAHTLFKVCKISCCSPPKKNALPTCSQKVFRVARNVLGLGLAVYWAWSLFSEKAESDFIGKVAEVFGRCVYQNVTHCCLEDWQGVAAAQHESPYVSLVNATVLPLLTMLEGGLVYQDLVQCCRKRSRVDLMPESASYNPVPTDQDDDI